MKIETLNENIQYGPIENKINLKNDIVLEFLRMMFVAGNF